LQEGGFPGRIFPINPREEEILGLKVYRTAEHIPEIPDLAIIVVPRLSVVRALKECASKGVKAAVIISAGFAETGDEGERLQQEIVKIARDSGMILVGPNCNGAMNPSAKLYAQMTSIFPHPGPIAVVAQSGNVAFSVTRRAMLRGFGCSKYISTGNEAVLHGEDYLEYLASDPQTKVILSYIEGLRDGRRFYQIAKEVSKKKPVVVLKGGESPAGAKAAASHTASLAGSDTIFEAACQQAGLIRAGDPDELLNTGLAFLRQPLPRGRRVGILTAGGGWGVLAADACARQGLEVVSLPDETIRTLDSLLPSWWNRGNPVDLVAGVRGDAVLRSIETLLQCPVVDSVIFMGIVVVLPTWRPQHAAAEEVGRWEEAALSTICDVFGQLNELAIRFQKPVIAASDIPFAEAGFETRLLYTLGKRDHVCYTEPHQAAVALANLVRYSQYTGYLSRQ
jgi:acyl-CoA synthetase (NDP forming)